MFKNNKVILLVLLIIVAFAGYRFVFKKDAPMGDSSLTVDSSAEGGGQSAIGKDLIVTLSKLKSLALDDTFFNDPIFNNLNDFSVPIVPQEIGRDNPFSPISGSVNLESGSLSGDKKAQN
ncbi:MAG: hypothetical protein UV08_C0024G0004 [Parcubacteria group bacterium GW2011_GWA2_42_18]|nr:MAG: hypothetical protein UV08_C0024G0004 [Parcubacteria group bacterium GW2011_GWA2_42_18]